jgi:REP-associated tyrosine transposase
MSKRFKKLSHSIYECKYHAVFCPKYRYRIFGAELGRYTGEQIRQLLRQKGLVEVLELNVQPDHVHLVVEIPPKYAVSALMGFLKGKLAQKLFAQYPQLGRKYWGRHLWARGYCVSTVGIDEEQIRQYVRWQEKQEHEEEQRQRRLFEH